VDAETFERIAEHVHRGWAAEKQRQGFADHVWQSDGGRGEDRGCATCTAKKDYYRSRAMHHADMLPYADLAENIKDYDRATVHAVLAGIDAAGLTVVPAESLRRIQTAVAMLNSMVLSGEDHSDTSRAVVREALNSTVPA
jgi:hypothetical protein